MDAGRAAARAQLCHGLRSSVLDDFFPLPYGAPMSHGVRPGCCREDVGDDAKLIEPSMPPKDSEGAPADAANGLSGGAGSPSERSPLDPLANGFDSTSAERSAAKLDGAWYGANPLNVVGVGSGSWDGHIDPSLPPNDSTGGRGEEDAERPYDVISASKSSDMLLSERDRDREADRSARELELGPATGSSSCSDGTGGRFREGRARGVAGGGESGTGGGADSVRSVGG